MVGNKFSQYRMATMHYAGLGTMPDLVEAYAWTRVAAELGDQIVLNLLEEIRAQLAPEQIDAAQKRADEYFAQYGIYASADRAQQLIRAEKRECTGSRLGSTCFQSSSSTSECNAHITTRMAHRCLVFGSVGLAGVGGSKPLELRQVEEHIAHVLDEYRPGRIEFRELRVIEPESDTEADSSAQ